jgi:hypothetical protein
VSVTIRALAPAFTAGDCTPGHATLETTARFVVARYIHQNTFASRTFVLFTQPAKCKPQAVINPGLRQKPESIKFWQEYKLVSYQLSSDDVYLYVFTRCLQN